MSQLKTPPPPPNRQPPPSPNKLDGIDTRKDHLPRRQALNDIYGAAKEHQVVVVGSPASTGKSSLLTLLRTQLEADKATVLEYRCRAPSYAEAERDLRRVGFPTLPADMRKLKNTWLLLDDAQEMYSEEYHRFWATVVKGVTTAGCEGEVFVVIAATYDLATPRSPVVFALLPHVDPNICETEAKQLIQMHLGHRGFGNWDKFSNTVLGLSVLPGHAAAAGDADDDKFHIGVIMAAVRLVEIIRKLPNTTVTEETMLSYLRGGKFFCQLDRCFMLGSDTVATAKMKDQLLLALFQKEARNQDAPLNASLIGPLIRSGVLTTGGRFSCKAALWYYNNHCFPGRATVAPKTLRELIIKAVGSMSAKKLRDAVQAEFPKEAAFQHLFNETLSVHLPVEHMVIPELNTRAVDLEDPSAGPVTGELDFYVNGDLQWCIEVDRKGDQIGKHLGRFCGVNGKYREVKTNDYYVVDCRGPKVGGGVKLKKPHRCTLYFDVPAYKTCICEIEGHDDVIIELQM